MSIKEVFLLACCIFFIALCLSLFIGPISISLSKKLNFLDKPGGRKRHGKPKPCLGGLVVLCSFWITIGIGLYWAEHSHYSVLPISVHPSTPLLYSRLFNIFLGSLFIFTVGLADDRMGLHPILKLISQILASAFIVFMGLKVGIFSEFPWVSELGTVFWLVLLMNAFNFIDSIDGHAAGVALISCLFFFMITLLIRQALVGFFVIALAGSLLGFLRYNWKPAKIFLGDNGSLTVGYLLGTITLLCDYHRYGLPPVTFLIPVIIFGVPLYDTLSVVIVRLSRGQKPWLGDRSHFAHRLTRLGMGDKNAVRFSYLVTIALGMVALLYTQLHTNFSAMLNFLIFISILMIIAYLEYYASSRVQLLEKIGSHKRRRKEDIIEEEDKLV